MNDNHFYYISIRGRVDEADMAASTPLKLAVNTSAHNATVLSVETDQSGLMGVLRYLHGRGFFILAVRIDETNNLNSD